MKRVLIFVSMIVALTLIMSLVCLAQDIDRGEELKSYIEEKIVPVVVGVATGIIGLVATLGSVGKSLKGLKDIKELFSSESEKDRQSFIKSKELLENKATEIKDSVKNVPLISEDILKLRGQVDILTDRCALMAEIISLGFSADPLVVRSGKGREMASLLQRAGAIGKGIEPKAEEDGDDKS